jgi:pimeloyl-ACP methyl ester carboxylesterase
MTTAAAMPLLRRLLLAASLLLAAAAAPALAFSAGEEERYRAVFSAASLGVARPSANLVASFTLHYRGAMPHAAFALATEAATGRSAWAFVGGQPTPEAAAAAALERCRRSLGQLQAECRLGARDGTPAAPPSAGVAPQTGTLGPFRLSPLHLRRGPEAARGVLVWGHGYGGPDRDNRNAPTPGLVSVLNDAGWDVLRFDRHPGEDAIAASLPRLVSGLPALRAAGYRQVVLGGQSRGGWQAIMAAAERPELVHAVLATAPAAHGEAQRPNNHGAALDDFRRLLAGLPVQGGPRLLVALFDEDPFDPDPERRAALLEALARERGAPTLALWPQAAPPIRGHNGLYEPAFTRLYGACVLTLVQAPEAAAPRGLRRAPCGGG